MIYFLKQETSRKSHRVHTKLCIHEKGKPMESGKDNAHVLQSLQAIKDSQAAQEDLWNSNLPEFILGCAMDGGKAVRKAFPAQLGQIWK
jgi:hypothetical protein